MTGVLGSEALIRQVDEVVRSTLGEMTSFTRNSTWTGRRERELVSLYAFGYLIPACRPGGFLHDPAQIAIEVVVPQIAGQRTLTGKLKANPQVCKDLVIWPQPRMTAWEEGGATAHPSCIIEWKHDFARRSYDLPWLVEFSRAREDFVGFVVRTSGRQKNFTLVCDRVHRGDTAASWLELPS